MIYRNRFSPRVKRVIDFVAMCAVAFLSLLLGLRSPGDHVWDYTSGVLFLTGIFLVVGGTLLVVWAVKQLMHEPQAIRQSPTVKSAMALMSVLGLLLMMVVGTCALLALFVRSLTNDVTHFLHFAMGFDRYVDQMVAERSGIAALIVVIIVAEFAWNHPEWVSNGLARLKGTSEPDEDSYDTEHMATTHAEGGHSEPTHHSFLDRTFGSH